MFNVSDTTGEEDFEEFFTDEEILDMECFENLGALKNKALFDVELLTEFEETINSIFSKMTWIKVEIVALFTKMIPDFSHKETDKYLDNKM